jgi:hypothetical protein
VIVWLSLGLLVFHLSGRKDSDTADLPLERFLTHQVRTRALEAVDLSPEKVGRLSCFSLHLDLAQVPLAESSLVQSWFVLSECKSIIATIRQNTNSAIRASRLTYDFEIYGILPKRHVSSRMGIFTDGKLRGHSNELMSQVAEQAKLVEVCESLYDVVGQLIIAFPHQHWGTSAPIDRSLN